MLGKAGVTGTCRVSALILPFTFLCALRATSVLAWGVANHAVEVQVEVNLEEQAGAVGVVGVVDSSASFEVPDPSFTDAFPMSLFRENRDPARPPVLDRFNRTVEDVACAVRGVCRSDTGRNTVY